MHFVVKEVIGILVIINEGAGPICPLIADNDMCKLSGSDTGKIFINCNEEERGCSDSKKCIKKPFSEIKKEAKEKVGVDIAGCWDIQDYYGCVGEDQCVHQKVNGVCEPVCASGRSDLQGGDIDTFINCTNCT